MHQVLQGDFSPQTSHRYTTFVPHPPIKILSLTIPSRFKEHPSASNYLTRNWIIVTWWVFYQGWWIHYPPHNFIIPPHNSIKFHRLAILLSGFAFEFLNSCHTIFLFNKAVVWNWGNHSGVVQTKYILQCIRWEDCFFSPFMQRKREIGQALCKQLLVPETWEKASLGHPVPPRPFYSQA